MSTPYRVQRGDYLIKIAKMFGFLSWRRIYFDSDNTGFRRFRANPDLIYPGDVIQIPEGAVPPGPIPRDPTIRTIPDEKCCGLAYTDQECPYDGDKKNFKCPPGYFKSAWTCTEGTRTIYCGECTTEGVATAKQREAEQKGEDYGDCYKYPIACSIWYYL
jgi:LysM domain